MKIADFGRPSNRYSLPVIRQTEVAECGLACIAMIACYYGQAVNIRTLRRRFGSSSNGISLSRMIAISEELSLVSRAVRLNLDELKDLRLPCILHWGLNHFVVLKKVGNGGVVIHDPAQGRRSATMSEVDRMFTGVALELLPATKFPRISRTNSFRIFTLLSDTKGIIANLARIFVIGCAIELLALIGPFGLQIIVDKALVNEDIQLLTSVLMGLGVVLLLQSVLEGLQAWGVLTLKTFVSFGWSAALFSHLVRLPVSWFERRHIGDILSRYNSLEALQSALTTGLVSLILDVMLAVGMLMAMIIYSAKLAGAVFALFAVSASFKLATFPRYKALMEAEIISQAQQESTFMETIRNSLSMKALGLEPNRRFVWLNALANNLNINAKLSKLDIICTAVETIFQGLGRIILLWMGAQAVIHSSLSLGMFLAFTAYQEQFLVRASSLIDALGTMRLVSMHGERVAEITEEPPEVASAGLGSSAAEQWNSLTLDDVYFAYERGEAEAIRGVSLHIGEGECVAIVGQSGCGKSTMLKIAAGLLQPTKGRVLVSGEDIRNLGITNYRRAIGCVLQEDTLFAGTVIENIAGFDPHIDFDLIRKCASLASIEKDIDKMPMGYGTIVGEIGSTLSGGQKQRIILARALYRRPSILLLDEASSHLDENTEKVINAALREMKIPRLIIAHRQHTIDMADRVVCLSDGRLISA